MSRPRRDRSRRRAPDPGDDLSTLPGFGMEIGQQVQSSLLSRDARPRRLGQVQHPSDEVLPRRVRDRGLPDHGSRVWAVRARRPGDYPNQSALER